MYKCACVCGVFSDKFWDLPSQHYYYKHMSDNMSFICVCVCVFDEFHHWARYAKTLTITKYKYSLLVSWHEQVWRKNWKEWLKGNIWKGVGAFIVVSTGIEDYGALHCLGN